MQDFVGGLFNQDYSPRMGVDGQQIRTTKYSITIKEIIFGEDSQKHIDNEIARGRRPVMWDKQGTPDFAAWKTVLNERQATPWDGTAVFGFARVSMPKNGTVDMTQPTVNVKKEQAPASAPATGGFAGEQPSQNASMVQHAADQTPTYVAPVAGQAPVAPAPPVAAAGNPLF